MIFRRRKQQRDQILRAALEADKHLERAQELSQQIHELADESREARRRNHFGEAVMISFQPRRRRLPWSK